MTEFINSYERSTDYIDHLQLRIIVHSDGERSVNVDELIDFGLAYPDCNIEMHELMDDDGGTSLYALAVRRLADPLDVWSI